MKFSKLIKNSTLSVLISSLILGNTGYCSKPDQKNENSFAEKTLATTSGLIFTGGLIALGHEILGNSNSSEATIKINRTPRVLSQDLVTNFQQNKDKFVESLQSATLRNGALEAV